MIALPVPAETARQVVGMVPGKGILPAEELHVTLAFLGPVENQHLTKQGLAQLLAGFAARFPRIGGKLSGFGRFDGGPDGDALFLNADCPILPAVREQVVSDLKAAGAKYEQRHGFSPHVTLKYLDRKEPTPELKNLAPVDVVFSEIALYWAGERYAAPLLGEFTGAVSLKEWETPPGYAPAEDEHTCAACLHFRDASLGSPHHCRLYDVPVRPDYTCDSYEAAEQAFRSPQVSVLKQLDGKYRWTMLTSNAYKDREGETISTAALEADVLRTDRDKDYGPLLWWHLPEVVIGDCDFSMMYGRVLIESGTFKEGRVARAVKRNLPSLSGSIGIRHPAHEPDSQGVFHTIRRKERSILPKWKAANRFVRLVDVQIGEDDMASVSDKIKAFREILNDDSGDLVKSILSQATEAEKEAQLSGATFKEAEEADTAGTEKAKVAVEVDDKPASDEKPEEKKPAKSEEKKPAEEEGEEAPEGGEAELQYIGDMSPKEYGALMGKMFEAGTADMRKMLADHLASHGESKKEADDTAEVLLASTERIEALEKENAQLKETVKAQGETLKDLGGSMPKALAGFFEGYGSSQTKETEVSAETVKEKTPVADAAEHPVDNFMSFALRGTNLENGAGK